MPCSLLTKPSFVSALSLPASLHFAFPFVFGCVQTFMEKFGDMLEAAAETAIPAAPNAGGQSIGPTGPQEWEEWDDGPLYEFMIEEVILGFRRGILTPDRLGFVFLGLRRSVPKQVSVSSCVARRLHVLL